MKLNKAKLCYLASYATLQTPGVYKKIDGLIKAANNMGYKAFIVQNDARTIKERIELGNFLIKSDAKYFFIRSFNVLNIFLLVHFIIARLQGKILILDIPTPMKALYYEIFAVKKTFIKTFLYKFLYYANGPWVFWPFNIIIQYGEESRFFKIGNLSRTIKMGNGIDITRMSIRDKNYQWPSDNLILVGVASVAFYHGYDRVINAIAIWNNNSARKYNVLFKIIGNGSYINELKALTRSLNLTDYVFFLGEQDSRQILDCYSTSHLAVSSLGLFRISLNEASVLKSREYCLAGIPFIASGKDPDFDEQLPFRMLVSNDENIEDIITIFKEFDSKQKKYTNEEIRDYALRNLSFESKLRIIGFKSKL